MLAAIRSLGRAGYRVHAASPRPDAIGFASRYCTTRARCPAYDDPAYAAWARGYVADHGIAAVVPGGAFLHAVVPCFVEFRHLLPLVQDRRIVHRARSRSRVFEGFASEPTQLRIDRNSVV